MEHHGQRTMSEEIGYADWDKIVKVKEDSLKVIEANAKNLTVGRIIEQLVLDRALKERAKYPKPKLTKVLESVEKEKAKS